MENQVLITQITPDKLSELIRKTLKDELSKIDTTVNPAKFLTREETAKLLRVSYVTLWDWTNKGIIKASKIGTRVLYLESNVLEAVQEVLDRKNK